MNIEPLSIKERLDQIEQLMIHQDVLRKTTENSTSKLFDEFNIPNVFRENMRVIDHTSRAWTIEDWRVYVYTGNTKDYLHIKKMGELEHAVIKCKSNQEYVAVYGYKKEGQRILFILSARKELINA